MAASSSAGATQLQQVQSTIYKFDGKSNFAMWKRLMELCLQTSGYGEILEKGFVEPTEEEISKVDKKTTL